MLDRLKEEVYKANIDLVNKGLVIYTWGNVSGVDRNTNSMVIKPSGVDYKVLKPEDMVVVDLISGQVKEGWFKPSSDTPTHLELYRAFPNIGGITHTHSINAVSFAQAGCPIRAIGTTHADYFYGDVPCTRELSQEEVEKDYEINTGKVIIETFKQQCLDSQSIPGVLVKNHGPFTWVDSPVSSVYNSVVLEVIAEMNIKTLLINNEATMKKYVLDKHYDRKHGKNAYYGQSK